MPYNITGTLFAVSITLLSGHIQAQDGQRGGSNDACEDAIQLTVTEDCLGSNALYDATDATASLPAVECNGYTSVEANDLWFSFVAVSPATIVRVEGTGEYDPVVEGLSGVCGDLQSIGCADATFPIGDPLENSVETLTLATTVGSTYFIRVYGFWEPVPDSREFALCVFQAPGAPENDQCADVVPGLLEPGAPLTFTGDDTGSLDTEGLGVGSVWIAFTTSACQNVTMGLCGSEPLRSGAFDGLYLDCSFATAVSATSMETSSCAEGNATLVFEALAAGTYYYPLFLEEGAGGVYQVQLTAQSPTEYCGPVTEECDEFIARVIMGAIDNSTDCAAGSVSDQTAFAAEIERLESVNITVFNGPVPYEEDSVTVWVDWNQDLAFCSENERYVLSSADDGVTFTGSLTAPAEALLGPTRMRIRMTYDERPEPCGWSEYGEVEDYTIAVVLFSGLNAPQKEEFTIYPNPSTGPLFLRSPATGPVRIDVVDALGRVVFTEQRTVVQGANAIMADGYSLASGSYTVAVTGKDNRWVTPLVVQ